MDAVKGLSIGYRTIDQDFTEDGTRLLKELELWEVSVVSLPMNPLAQVAHAKSQLSAIGEYVPTPREFERILRDVGCSQKVAKCIMSKLFESESADLTEAGLEQVASKVEERLDDATAVAKLSGLFENEESARDASDSTRDVEVDEKDMEATRDVELSDDEAGAVAAANRIAEQMWAMTIRVPRI
jgi:hypothetical protein